MRNGGPKACSSLLQTVRANGEPQGAFVYFQADFILCNLTAIVHSSESCLRRLFNGCVDRDPRKAVGGAITREPCNRSCCLRDNGKKVRICPFCAYNIRSVVLSQPFTLSL